MLQVRGWLFEFRQPALQMKEGFRVIFVLGVVGRGVPLLCRSLVGVGVALLEGSGVFVFSVWRGGVVTYGLGERWCPLTWSPVIGYGWGY